MTSTNDIRRSFLDYFARHEHAEVASAPLVPFSDPTLMFVNCLVQNERCGFKSASVNRNN